MPRSNRPENPYSTRLTQREIEILSLVALGHSSAEIADALFIATRTVSFHLANVYQKLNVNNRVQAFRAANRLGLLPAEPGSRPFDSLFNPS